MCKTIYLIGFACFGGGGYAIYQKTTFSWHFQIGCVNFLGVNTTSDNIQRLIKNANFASTDCIDFYVLQRIFFRSNDIKIKTFAICLK